MLEVNVGIDLGSHTSKVAFSVSPRGGPPSLESSTFTSTLTLPTPTSTRPHTQLNIFKRLLGPNTSKPNSAADYLEIGRIYTDRIDIPVGGGPDGEREVGLQHIPTGSFVPSTYVLALVLRKIHNTIADTLAVQDPASTQEMKYKAVITVPTSFTVAQRLALSKAAKRAGFGSVGLITDMTAAVSTYAVSSQASAGFDSGMNTLFIDVGYSYSTVAIISFANKEHITVKGLASSPALGIHHTDMSLLDAIAAQILPKYQLHKVPPGTEAAILAQCKEARHALTVLKMKEAKFEFSLPAVGASVNALITRNTLQLAVLQCTSALHELLESAFNDNGIPLSSIGNVIFLGAASSVIKDEIMKDLPNELASQDVELAAKGALAASYFLSDEKTEDYHWFKDISDHIGSSFSLDEINGKQQLTDDIQSRTAISHIDKTLKLKLVSNPLELLNLHDDPSYNTLNNLSMSLHESYSQDGNRADLDNAIIYQEIALNGMNNDDKDYTLHLSNMSMLMHSCYNLQGDLHDLDLAIQYMKSVLDLTEDSNTMKSAFLSNYSAYLSARYRHLQNEEDLQDAVQNLEKAIDLAMKQIGNGLFDKSLFIYLYNLGNVYQELYIKSGKLEDLNRAIRNHQSAVDSTPDDVSSAGYFNALAGSLVKCFKHLGDMDDISKAISLHTNAVELSKDGYISKPLYLNNLATALKYLFTKRNDIDVLNSAILFQSHAISLTSPTAFDKADYIHNLGLLLMMRFDHQKDVSDLDTAIQRYEEAIALTPDSYTRRIIAFSINLGASLHKRYIKFNSINDLDKAIAHEESALCLKPHPSEKGVILLNMGFSHISRFEQLGNKEDLHKAESFFTEVLELPMSIELQFQAAKGWQTCTMSLGIGQAIQDATTKVLDLLDQLAWPGVHMKSQLESLKLAEQTACDAAAIALQHKDIEQALVWLEQGRSVAWNHVLQLRSPLLELQKVDPELATRITELSHKLEYSIASEGSNEKIPERQYVMSPEDIIQEHHDHALERDQLLQKARTIPGFENLMQRRAYSEFGVNLFDGPVIVINVSEYHCDAIITMPYEIPFCIKLDKFSYQQAKDLQSLLQKCLSSSGARHGGPIRQGDQSFNSDDSFRHILAELWLKVVEPIFDYLCIGLELPDKMPHFWWCPTGPLTFLPLHAAGIYPANGDYETARFTVLDYIVSSYIPSLSSLHDIVYKRNPLYTSPEILAVIQPETPGQAPLPATTKELHVIKNYTNDHLVNILEGSQATVDAVKNGIKSCSWVHLACHGKQTAEDPTSSGIYLHDGKLDLLDVIQNPPPNADFAFLSACQTASGDINQPNEAMHLAAGMIMAGYNGVIATMWSIGDEDAPLVANDVYKYLFRDGNPSSKEAARALHGAILNLKTKYAGRHGGKDFSSWVPYIHVGL